MSHNKLSGTKNVDSVENNENKDNNDNKDNKQSLNDPIPTDDSKRKKKTKHYFEHHIRKILKQVCTDRDITQQAKSQLNELAIITCKLIKSKITHILTFSKKKTITEAEIQSAVKLIFTGQLAQKSVDEGTKCLSNYLNRSKNEELKGQSRQLKADILIPPNILDTFLRENVNYISCNAPIFMAAVIEYFLSQILELANNVSSHKKGVRITVNDLEKGVKSDTELAVFFSTYNIYFFDSNIVPFVHPSFKKTGKNNKKSMKSIIKIQKSCEYVFPKSFFENKFKQYISLVYPEIRYQKGCFLYFQDYIEKWIIELLQYTNIITLFSKKSRVCEDDIEIVLSIQKRRIPDFIKNMTNQIDTETIPFETL